MKERLLQDEILIQAQKEELKKMGLTEEQIQRVVEPAISFYQQLKEEVAYYDRIKKGEFDALENLSGLGIILIGARIALGISQSDLANRLGVSEAQVSKGERNEYLGKGKAAVGRFQYIAGQAQSDADDEIDLAFSLQAQPGYEVGKLFQAHPAALPV